MGDVTAECSIQAFLMITNGFPPVTLPGMVANELRIRATVAHGALGQADGSLQHLTFTGFTSQLGDDFVGHRDTGDSDRMPLHLEPAIEVERHLATDV